ncbi:C-type lectin lectoxin-Thr1-like isoform X2 [Erythrolamprus reginae]|uniref:C-type lectin lectoxin-Thr1-like isoform X2 n=1 Tax=Erythrolamprus reginae TaxID=121349 RepID=UPI00396C6380
MGFFLYVGLCCLASLITNPFLGAKAATCPRDWLKKQGNCYGYFEEKLDWDGAELECQSYGSGYHLASILSPQEAALVSVYIRDKQGRPSNVWTGLFDASGKGRWRWADESTYNHKAWLVNQPDNSNGNEKCAELTIDSGFKGWNDRSCSSPNSYICKYQL